MTADSSLDLCVMLVYRRDGIVNLDYINLIAESATAADRSVLNAPTHRTRCLVYIESQLMLFDFILQSNYSPPLRFKKAVNALTANMLHAHAAPCRFLQKQ